MKTLTELYAASRRRLQSHLQGADSPEAAVKALHQELDRIQDPYLGDLFDHQSRVAIPLLNQARLLLRVLVGVEPKLRAPLPSFTADSSPMPWLLRTVPLRILEGLLAMALLYVLFVTVPDDPLRAFSGMGIVFVLVVLEVLGAVERAKRTPRVPENTVTPELGLNVDAEFMCEQLADLFAFIDHEVPAAEDVPATASEAVQPTTIGILEFLQQLLEDARFGDAELVLKRARGIPVALRKCGVELVEYDEGRFADETEAHSHFEFEPSVSDGPDHAVTLVPALVHDGQVLARGKVREAAPERSSGAQGGE